MENYGGGEKWDDLHEDGEVTGATRTHARDPEVAAKATRWRFTAAYKLSIVEEADACGRRRRSERCFDARACTVRTCRRGARRRVGITAGLAKKRGPKPSGERPEARKVRRLERQVARLREELRKARIIVDVQGKVAGLLGVNPGDGKRSRARPGGLAGHVGVRGLDRAGRPVAGATVAFTPAPAVGSADPNVPSDLDVHLVVDNCSTRKHDKVKLRRHPATLPSPLHAHLLLLARPGRHHHPEGRPPQLLLLGRPAQGEDPPLHQPLQPRRPAPHVDRHRRLHPQQDPETMYGYLRDTGR